MSTLSTAEWAKSVDISTDDIPPPLDIKDDQLLMDRIRYTAREIAIRAVVLQGVVAVGFGVDPEPIVEWFREQGIWEHVSPVEKEFLLSDQRSEQQRITFQWRQEAEWTLLWVVGKVKALGLPTHTCDTHQLVDEIIPALGSNIEAFLDSATLRPLRVILAEDERTYDMWCRAHQAQRNNTLPYDLNMSVLYQRRYAFEWLDGIDQWDHITCDT